jgi:methyl-accepting chemotaxis protein
MPIALRLMTPLVGLTVAPWIFIGYRQTLAAATASPGMAAAFLLTMAICVYIIARFALVEVSSEESLDQTLAEAAQENYAHPLRLDDAHGSSAKIEEMRRFLVDRFAELSTKYSNERRAALQAREEEERQSRGYVEAHEVFMSTFCAALDEMSKGNLSIRLDKPFSRDYERIRGCYNESVDRLSNAFRAARGGVEGLGSTTDEIAQASGSLAERTSHQAASLEETTAALKQITVTLARISDNAQKARELVAEIRGNAEESSEVVSEAIRAMERIAKSSEQIEQIIGVIDEIAFQTNLLALNAGVEAARAGEAGRGFAVVASEVRALAQRSAEAAKGIKSLIAGSTTEVRDGVQLVSKTGEALVRIVTQVGGATGLVSQIAEGAREQSSSLLEVDGALTEMDKFTQENAAMVQETAAATKNLDREIAAVVQTISTFKLEAGESPRRGDHPSRAPVRPKIVVGGRNMISSAEATGWEEF